MAVLAARRRPFLFRTRAVGRRGASLSFSEERPFPAVGLVNRAGQCPCGGIRLVDGLAAVDGNRGSRRLGSGVGAPASRREC